jgi:hypothetical protein
MCVIVSDPQHRFGDKDTDFHVVYMTIVNKSVYVLRCPWNTVSLLVWRVRFCAEISFLCDHTSSYDCMTFCSHVSVCGIHENFLKNLGNEVVTTFLIQGNSGSDTNVWIVTSTSTCGWCRSPPSLRIDQEFLFLLWRNKARGTEKTKIWVSVRDVKWTWLYHTHWVWKEGKRTLLFIQKITLRSNSNCYKFFVIRGKKRVKENTYRWVPVWWNVKTNLEMMILLQQNKKRWGPRKKKKKRKIEKGLRAIQTNKARVLKAGTDRGRSR